MPCEHKQVKRISRGDGLQNTANPRRKLIIGNCEACGTPVTIGVEWDGRECLQYEPQESGDLLGGVVYIKK
jgi:hypothetical protein